MLEYDPVAVIWNNYNNYSEIKSISQVVSLIVYVGGIRIR